MRISEKKIDFDDVLIRPRRSVTASRKDVKIEREFRFYHANCEWTGFPLMIANMGCTGTFKMNDELSRLKTITCLHKFYTIEEIEKYYFPMYNTLHSTNPNLNIVCDEFKYCWLSIGTRDIEKLKHLKENTFFNVPFPNLCVDVANGYTDDFVKKCSEIREIIGYDSIIMAGNVATPEMVQELIIHGKVDIVKVGIGPGRFCETRKVTGIGYPQLSAIIECADAAHGLKNGEKRMGLICGDGGCKTSGDLCKGFGANADFMMVGTMVAGTDECEGEWEYDNKCSTPKITTRQKKVLYTNPDYKEYFKIGNVVDDNKRDRYSIFEIKDYVYDSPKLRLKFYGMSSDHAQIKHYGKKIEYAASEGKVDWVDYKGPVSNIIAEIQGGLRSCCAYVGSTSLKDLSKCTEFIRI